MLHLLTPIFLYLIDLVLDAMERLFCDSVCITVCIVGVSPLCHAHFTVFGVMTAG